MSPDDRVAVRYEGQIRGLGHRRFLSVREVFEEFGPPVGRLTACQHSRTRGQQRRKGELAKRFSGIHPLGPAAHVVGVSGGLAFRGYGAQLQVKWAVLVGGRRTARTDVIQGLGNRWVGGDPRFGGQAP